MLCPEPMFTNIAGYQFAHLSDLQAMRKNLLDCCIQQSLKGTILVTPEGINAFVAGTQEAIDILLKTIRAYPELANFSVKESFSNTQPFARMLVRIKKEIISFGVEKATPFYRESPRLSATQLKEWLDTGKEVILLDTRNKFEVDIGTFEHAQHLDITTFRQFANKIEAKKADWQDKPIVTFCTGGVRCEKAAPFMELAGFENVYQLDGGILKYFEECGGKHYTGDCFVFDRRVALNPKLEPTGHALCYDCRGVLQSPGDPCLQCNT